jgi:hypothetical protein
MHSRGSQRNIFGEVPKRVYFRIVGFRNFRQDLDLSVRLQDQHDDITAIPHPAVQVPTHCSFFNRTSILATILEYRRESP